MFVLMIIALIMLTASTGYLPIAVLGIGVKPLDTINNALAKLLASAGAGEKDVIIDSKILVAK